MGTLGRSLVPFPWSGIQVLPPSTVLKIRPTSAGIGITANALESSAAEALLETTNDCRGSVPPRLAALRGNATELVNESRTGFPVASFARSDTGTPVVVVVATVPPDGFLSVTTAKQPPPSGNPYSRAVTPSRVYGGEALGSPLHPRGVAAVARAGPTEAARRLNGSGGPEGGVPARRVESHRRADAVAADELIPDLQLGGREDRLGVAVQQPARAVVLQAGKEQRGIAGGGISRSDRIHEVGGDAVVREVPLHVLPEVAVEEMARAEEAAVAAAEDDGLSSHPADQRGVPVRVGIRKRTAGRRAQAAAGKPVARVLPGSSAVAGAHAAEVPCRDHPVRVSGIDGDGEVVIRLTVPEVHVRALGAGARRVEQLCCRGGNARFQRPGLASVVAADDPDRGRVEGALVLRADQGVYARRRRNRRRRDCQV